MKKARYYNLKGNNDHDFHDDFVAFAKSLGCHFEYMRVHKGHTSSAYYQQYSGANGKGLSFHHRSDPGSAFHYYELWLKEGIRYEE